MKPGFGRRALGAVVVLAAFDLVGCGEAQSESSGAGASGTTGAMDGAGGASGASTSTSTSTSTSGGASTSGGSTTSSGSSASSDSGASGGSGGTENAGGAGGVPTGGVANVEELCAAYPVAWGAYMARCHGGDAEQWEKTAHTPCGSAIQSEGQGRIRLNRENAATCLDALAEHDCSGASIPVSAGCSDLFTGTVPAGEACNRLELWGGDECESGAFCNAEVLGGCTSVCSTYLQLGQGCTGQFESTPCAPGTECDPNEGCIVPADDGEVCSESWDCRSYHCMVPDAGAPGTCESPTTEGGSCTTASQCAGGLRCVGDTGEKTCVPPKPVGEPCTFGWRECTGHCSLDGVCAIAADEGEPCGSQTDPVTERSENIPCSGGLFCDLEDQTCRPLLQPGEQCSSNGNCAAVGDRVARCDEGECTTCD